jgi:hypothetical protein
MGDQEGAVMKNRIVWIGLLAYVFLCHASTMHAQTPAKPSPPEAPILPMDVKFRYVPQYFEQSFPDDPRYTRIVALVDQRRCDVVLLDKTTNREAFYSTLDRKVRALSADGAHAYTTPIDFTASSTIDSYPLFVIRFHDRFGQEVTWQFVAGELLPHASQEVISRADNSGIAFLYAPRRAAAVPGTTLTIAARTYRPESRPSDDALGAFYATDMTVTQILPGTDLWRTEDSPANPLATAKWNLSDDDGRRRHLALEQVSGTEAEVDQSDLDDPDAPQIVLNLQRVNDTFGVHSLSFKAHDNTLWIFFGPPLPLPAHQINDKTTVAFTVAENEQATVARGALEVQRAVDAEHLVWRFDTPSLARSTTFETGVNLIPSASEQANFVNENCMRRSPNQL